MKTKSKKVAVKKVTPKAKKLTALVIDRKMWWRGHSDNSALVMNYYETNKMCCLGFLGKACGIKVGDMAGIVTPHDSEQTYVWKKWPAWVNVEVGDSPWVKTAVKINDNEKCTEALREKKLITHFAKNGVKLSFKG
jgi:hypothetical protein